MVGAAQCDLLASPAMTKPTLEHRVNPARGRGKSGGYGGPLAMARANLITKCGCILRTLDGRLGEKKPQTDRARGLKVAPQAGRDALGRNPHSDSIVADQLRAAATVAIKYRSENRPRPDIWIRPGQTSDRGQEEIAEPRLGPDQRGLLHVGRVIVMFLGKPLKAPIQKPADHGATCRTLGIIQTDMSARRPGSTVPTRASAPPCPP